MTVAGVRGMLGEASRGPVPVPLGLDEDVGVDGYSDD